MKLTSAYLGHHGLVAGIYDELGIGNIIDKTLPKQGQHKLPTYATPRRIVPAGIARVQVMIPTFACFCFNIHEIVQIKSLNLMFIHITRTYAVELV